LTIYGESTAHSSRAFGPGVNMPGVTERNYLGRPLRVPEPCRVCKGTGKRQTLGGARWDNTCRHCVGEGVLRPDPPADDQNAA
jgi:hypothetical protein